MCVHLPQPFVLPVFCVKHPSPPSGPCRASGEVGADRVLLQSPVAPPPLQGGRKGKKHRVKGRCRVLSSHGPEVRLGVRPTPTPPDL